MKEFMEDHSSSAHIGLKCIQRLIIQLPESYAEGTELIRCFGLWNTAKQEKKKNEKGKSKACLLAELPVTEMAPRDPSNRSRQKTWPSLSECWWGTFWGLLSNVAEKEILGKNSVCGINSKSYSANGLVSKEDAGNLPFWVCKWQKGLRFVADCLAYYLVYLDVNSKRGKWV